MALYGLRNKGRSLGYAGGVMEISTTTATTGTNGALTITTSLRSLDAFVPVVLVALTNTTRAVHLTSVSGGAATMRLFSHSNTSGSITVPIPSDTSVTLHWVATGQL